MIPRLVTIATVFLLACSGRVPERIADCKDAECRTSWLLKAWEESPQKAIDGLQVVTDPVEFEVAVIALAEAHPGETGLLCQRLPDGRASTRCAKINVRPHLMVVESKAPHGDEAPAFTFLRSLQEAPLPNSWAGQKPGSPGACAQDTLPVECLTRQAILAALTDHGEAASICLAIETKRWRDECFFEVAENIGGGGPAAAVVPGMEGPALSFCSGAGEYQADCVRHLIQVHSERVPAADEADQSGWNEFFSSMGALREPIDAYDTQLGSLFFDAALSFAARRSFTKAQAVRGGALQVVPPEMVPHIRAAAARASMDKLAPQVSLDQAVQEVARSLTQVGTLPSRGLTATGVKQEKPTWGHMLQGEEGLPWVHYSVQSPRAFDEDPTTDLTICVVEAAASAGFRHTQVLADGLRHPSAKVRWTAARVLWYFPGAQVGSLPVSDADPLVQARLDRLAALRAKSAAQGHPNPPSPTN